MPIQRISRSFKDISLSFVPHPVTKDLPILTNENAIIRSVRNLVETIPTERFFNSLIGSRVEDSMFELQTPEVAYSLELDIKTLLKNFGYFLQDHHIFLYFYLYDSTSYHF